MDPREALRSYLTEHEIKPAEFSRSLDYDKSNFHRLLTNPKAKPSLDLAARIERQTGGVIPATAWAQAA